ncbi:recombinase family protein [Ruminococcaceae bacterium OttesenSCG-928-L11]|nr:recombinase family protein [Ruminococcaceae bacterium OttesenSCG-928-L11]
MARPVSAGIYTRVSVEDRRQREQGILRSESGSVENQRKLLTDYAQKQGWHIEKIYCDDGWSGSNCDRPAFQEMMDDVRSRRINLILIKDMSRFGRNYIEVGKYTDYMLPMFGCRLVAMADNIDTGQTENDMMPFYSLLNDQYLKDLSNKIKAAHRSMALEGKRVSGRPPYGYRVDPGDKHNFLIDDYASVVVKRIFEMRMQNTSYGKIAGILNTEGILSPLLYEYQHNGREWPRKSRSVWGHSSVKAILENPAYIGCREQLRYGSVSYRFQKAVKMPEETWVRVENAHEPIIDKDTWSTVQEINQRAGLRQKNAHPPSPSLFRGLLRCADCGGTMTPTNIRHTYTNGTETVYRTYECARYSTSGRTCCSTHRIKQDVLKQLVLEDIQTHARKIALDKGKMRSDLVHRLNGVDSAFDTAAQIKQIDARLNELDKKEMQLYEDKVAGTITADTLTMLLRECERERCTRQEEQRRLRENQAGQEKSTQDISEWMDKIERYGDVDDIDRNLLEELVEHIEVGAPDKDESGIVMRDIRVFYRHVGEV